VNIGNIWLGVGFAGQLLFFLRFVVQWIVSENKKESVIPLSFWYFSIGGAAILLVYAIWRKDPVFIAGQSCGFVVYFRNIVLIKRKSE
jgi:lipid-A-disaccharide synthase-like uncharacterized protein